MLAETSGASCSAHVGPTAAQLSWLKALPDLTGPPEDEAAWPCELADGHEGNHVSLGSYGVVRPDGSMVDVWLTWVSGGEPARAEMDSCEAEHGEVIDDDPEFICHLPSGHSGPHSCPGATWT